MLVGGKKSGCWACEYWREKIKGSHCREEVGIGGEYWREGKKEQLSEGLKRMSFFR